MVRYEPDIYRKRPTIYRALRYTGKNRRQVLDWAGPELIKRNGKSRSHELVIIPTSKVISEPCMVVIGERHEHLGAAIYHGTIVMRQGRLVFHVYETTGDAP